MKVTLPLILIPLVLASGCNPRTDQPVSPPEDTRLGRASADAQAPASSIIRPEVAEEVGAPQAPPIPEDLKAVVTFEQGARIDDAARAALADLVAQPGFSTGGAITLSGHSDTSGSDADNLATSLHRAEAVRDHLVSLGVKEDRITVIALGERRAIAPNARPDGSDDPEGRRRNRRVEIVVAAPSPSAPSPDNHTRATSVPAAAPSGVKESGQ